MAGFAITKADIFPSVAARGAGQIALVSLLLNTLSDDTEDLHKNITIPSLMFSKIVPAFTPSNIGALGSYDHARWRKS
jgi:hypothetical protein